MTRGDLTTLLEQEVKGLSSKLVAADYSNAIDQAERDTGWTVPVTTSFQIKWVKERAKRALFSFLQAEAASKFQYEGIHLEHRFKHYSTLIAAMDKEFERVWTEYPDEFAGVDSFRLFGHKIDAGFAYESQTHRDTTYDDENLVIFTPNEGS
jgi:hypothetical protein